VAAFDPARPGCICPAGDTCSTPNPKYFKSWILFFLTATAFLTPTHSAHNPVFSCKMNWFGGLLD
jgi:hypothetical protein